MKKILCILTFLPVFSNASVDMTRIKAELFIAQPRTSFDSIVRKDPMLKKQLIQQLFDKDMVNHELSKAFSADARFDAYYTHFEKSYQLIDMDQDGVFELVFSGFVSRDDEKEHFEIYAFNNGKPARLYEGIGHLLAYKVHPNTGEILLYHHQYPCCLNASHNINRLRKTGNKLQLLKKYFVAREAGDMKGRFFPEKTSFSGKYKMTKTITKLHWSPDEIAREAWVGRVPQNVVARYPEKSIYRVLAKEQGWQYVLMYTPPLQETNLVINPANFSDVKVFGWIRVEEK